MPVAGLPHSLSGSGLEPLWAKPTSLPVGERTGSEPVTSRWPGLSYIIGLSLITQTYESSALTRLSYTGITSKKKTTLYKGFAIILSFCYPETALHHETNLHF